jgi:hypothetical protein
MVNKIPIEYKLTITGDNLKGKGASDFGDRTIVLATTAMAAYRKLRIAIAGCLEYKQELGGTLSRQVA